MTGALLAGALAVVVLLATTRARQAGRRRRAVDRLARPNAALSAERLPAPPQWLSARLDDAAVTADGRVVYTAWLLAAAVGPLSALLVAGPGLAIAVALVAVVFPLLLLRSCAGRRSASIEAALPAALEAVARALRTGSSLRQAVGEAATAVAPPLRNDLATVATQVERGAPLTVALESWAEACPVAGVRLAVAALALGADTGGAQARAVDGVAATIRERLSAAAEMKAQSTQARVSGGVIALSPIAFSALASATDPRTATFLFRTAPGLVLLTAGLGLDALGAVWMSRITRIAP